MKYRNKYIIFQKESLWGQLHSAALTPEESLLPETASLIKLQLN